MLYCTSALSEPHCMYVCMYVNDSRVTWPPFPVEDSGLANHHKLKTTKYHVVLRTGFSVNMFCM